jgi:hypothetical protein
MTTRSLQGTSPKTTRPGTSSSKTQEGNPATGQQLGAVTDRLSEHGNGSLTQEEQLA